MNKYLFIAGLFAVTWGLMFLIGNTLRDNQFVIIQNTNTLLQANGFEGL